jgi:hypothetical protein
MPAPKGNKYAIGNKGGRPPKYKTPEAMAKEIDAYFEYIKGEQATNMEMVTDPKTLQSSLQSVTRWVRPPEPATIMGLILYLGFSSLQAFDHYEENDEDFLRTIQRGRARVMQAYEIALHSRETVRGAMFILPAMGLGGKTEITYYGKDGKPVDPPSNNTIVTNVLPNTNKDL